MKQDNQCVKPLVDVSVVSIIRNRYTDKMKQDEVSSFLRFDICLEIRCVKMQFRRKPLINAFSLRECVRICLIQIIN